MPCAALQNWNCYRRAPLCRGLFKLGRSLQPMHSTQLWPLSDSWHEASAQIMTANSNHKHSDAALQERTASTERDFSIPEAKNGSTFLPSDWSLLLLDQTLVCLFLGSTRMMGWQHLFALYSHKEICRGSFKSQQGLIPL